LVFSKYFDYVFKTGDWQKAIRELITCPKDFQKNLDSNIYDCESSFKNHEWCFPAFDLLPMEEYKKIHPNQIEFSVQRGCVFNCPFCSEKFKISENKTYQRDPEEIVKFIKENPGYYYYFDATTFTQNRQWVKELCEKLEPLNINWRTVTRINQIDEEIANILSKAGCDKIGFGVETFSKEDQIKFNKPMTPEIVKKHSEILSNEGIIPRAFFILGLPGQTKEDILETQKKIEELGIEYRWKEYIPFEKVLSAKTIEDFQIFERSIFPKHQIKGLSQDFYNKLLAIER
jgi:anaerobic magnesium-protoporphyrin IX monomethyl ester cyclase